MVTLFSHVTLGASSCSLFISCVSQPRQHISAKATQQALSIKDGKTELDEAKAQAQKRGVRAAPPWTEGAASGARTPSHGIHAPGHQALAGRPFSGHGPLQRRLPIPHQTP